MEPDELITFRVQYLVDSDPLSACTAFPIPVRAPTYAFATTMPLANQLGTILRLLNAPQSVRYSVFTLTEIVYKSLNIVPLYSTKSKVWLTSYVSFKTYSSKLILFKHQRLHLKLAIYYFIIIFKVIMCHQKIPYKQYIFFHSVST